MQTTSKPSVLDQVTVEGVPIIRHDYMEGCKSAVSTCGSIYVSPAMFDLISHAEGEELTHLLEQIPVTVLDGLEDQDPFAKGRLPFSLEPFPWKTVLGDG